VHSSRYDVTRARRQSPTPPAAPAPTSQEPATPATPTPPLPGNILGIFMPVRSANLRSRSERGKREASEKLGVRVWRAKIDILGCVDPAFSTRVHRVQPRDGGRWEPPVDLWSGGGEFGASRSNAFRSHDPLFRLKFSLDLSPEPSPPQPRPTPHTHTGPTSATSPVCATRLPPRRVPRLILPLA
jgi:hypothetical protein